MRSVCERLGPFRGITFLSVHDVYLVKAALGASGTRYVIKQCVTADLVCQEYVVRTATIEHHIRQPKQHDQGLLPLNSAVEFTLDKDKMKFKLDGKKYEFLVVSEASGVQETMREGVVQFRSFWEPRPCRRLRGQVTARKVDDTAW